MEAMLAHLGAMLGYVGPAGRHLGATWRQDEAQERQDEPRWRTGAPRRGKIGELRRRGLLLGGRNPCPRTRPAPLHPPKNGFSRMGLQKGSPDSDSNWNWIWKTGRLEDWKTGGQENWRTGGLRGHCTRNCACGTVADIYIYSCSRGRSLRVGTTPPSRCRGPFGTNMLISLT